jgi:RNA polymerase sigma-70 factor, ECF subfamily
MIEPRSLFVFLATPADGLFYPSHSSTQNFWNYFPSCREDTVTHQTCGAKVDELQSRSDAELLKLSIAGEESAFRLLYERLKTGVFRYAFYMTNSRSSAEDVTQEVFISLLKEGRNYREEKGEVAGFAFGIARNFVRRIERRERPYGPLPNRNDEFEKLSGTPTTELETISGQMIRNELVERVHSAIASLPDHYCQVVVLCDLCELSYEQAASRLGCAVGTIRSRLNRAHALLAHKLKPLRSSQAALGSPGAEGCLI